MPMPTSFAQADGQAEAPIQSEGGVLGVAPILHGGGAILASRFHP